MPDVLIIGGGPSGSAAARLLSLWGHSVRLLTLDPSTHRPGLAESLPPSCERLFAVLGVADAIDRASFMRSTGNTVWWESGEGRVERFATGRWGWQVTADRLAAVLQTAARDAGVQVEYARATIEDLGRAPEPFLLDCSGRTGLFARALGWRRYEAALRTVALVGAWRREGGWPLADPSHTLIESYADGWLWSVPVTNEQRYVAAMIDPRTSQLEGEAARQVYLRELEKAPQFAALFAAADFHSGPWGWDASMYDAREYADERVLLVGDAGSFVDPLSSAGVKKALASGWLAAVAVHTALVRPAMRDAAFRFFAAREREMYASLRAMTERHLGDAAAERVDPFWLDREFVAAPGAEAEIAAAFDRIRREAELRVRRGAVAFEDRPAVSGCEIVLERRVVHADLPQGMRYLHHVDVVSLIELAPQHDDVGRLFDAYVRQVSPVALPDLLRALSTALARGWLVWI